MYNPLVQHQVKYLFTNNITTDKDIYSPALSKITEAQHRLMFSRYFKDKPFKIRDSKISPKVIDDIRVLTYDKNA